MKSTLWCSLAWLALFMSDALAQDTIHLDKLHRLDLPVRQAGERSVTDVTKFVSVDVYHHAPSKRRFYVGEGGAQLAVVTGGAADKDQAKAKPLHRLILPVRTFEEADFGDQTRQLSVEVFLERSSGQLIYASDGGAFAVVSPRKPLELPVKEQKPRWLERLPAKVRKSGEFLRPDRTCNFELYLDDATGCLILAGENGALAVLPGGQRRAKNQPMPLEWSHGLDLRVRAPGHKEFDAKSPTYGIEVYEIACRNAWLYLTESLHVAVIPGEGPGEPFERPKAPLWTGRFQPAGKGPPAWSGEMFDNPNTGHKVFITAKGAIAVLP